MTILETFTVQIKPRLYRIAGEWTDNAESGSVVEVVFEGGQLPLYDICYFDVLVRSANESLLLISFAVCSLRRHSRRQFGSPPSMSGHILAS